MVVKGAEYALPGNSLPEEEIAVVESYGGRIEYAEMTPGVSTTDLVRRQLELRA